MKKNKEQFSFFITFFVGVFLFLLSCAGLWLAFKIGSIILGILCGSLLFSFIMFFDTYYANEDF